jgi:hypothetical protein
VTGTNSIPFTSADFINGKVLQKIEYAQNSQKVYSNDVVFAQQVGPNVNVDSFINQVSLGAINNGTGLLSLQNANVEIGEIMFFNSILNASQILAVESYLKTKWGYTSW